MITDTKAQDAIKQHFPSVTFKKGEGKLFRDQLGSLEIMTMAELRKEHGIDYTVKRSGPNLTVIFF